MGGGEAGVWWVVVRAGGLLGDEAVSDGGRQAGRIRLVRVDLLRDARALKFFFFLLRFDTDTRLDSTLALLQRCSPATQIDAPPCFPYPFRSSSSGTMFVALLLLFFLYLLVFPALFVFIFAVIFSRPLLTPAMAGAPVFTFTFPAFPFLARGLLASRSVFTPPTVRLGFSSAFGFGFGFGLGFLFRLRFLFLCHRTHPSRDASNYTHKSRTARLSFFHPFFLSCSLSFFSRRAAPRAVLDVPPPTFEPPPDHHAPSGYPPSYPDQRTTKQTHNARNIYTPSICLSVFVSSFEALSLLFVSFRFVSFIYYPCIRPHPPVRPSQLHSIISPVHTHILIRTHTYPHNTYHTHIHTCRLQTYRYTDRQTDIRIRICTHTYTGLPIPLAISSHPVQHTHHHCRRRCYPVA